MTPIPDASRTLRLLEGAERAARSEENTVLKGFAVARYLYGRGYIAGLRAAGHPAALFSAALLGGAVGWFWRMAYAG